MRRRTFFGGRVLFNHRLSSMDCLVKDMGERGAKLVFPNPTVVPEEFDLRIERLERSFRVRVAWRRETEVGVVLHETEPGDNVVSLEGALRLRAFGAETHGPRDHGSDPVSGPF